MARLAHALVIDSGVGALSIIQEIRARLPGISLSYTSDNAFFPYGEKGEEELVERVHKLVATMIKKTDPDIVVIACNTASTIALPSVREYFDLPIVGVVPAIKPAGGISKTRIIGLVGTPGTVNRSYTNNLISQYAPDCTVIKVGSSALVHLAEQKLRGMKIDQDKILEALSPLIYHPQFLSVDTIVLACTHFPLLKSELAAAIHRPIHWLDSGQAIANRVEFLLREKQLNSENGLLLESANIPQVLECYFTKDTPSVRELYPELGKRLSDAVHFVDVLG